MASCLHPYPLELPLSHAASASHQPARLKWAPCRRHRRCRRLRCVAASAATLQRELLMLPSPSTSQNPVLSNPRNLFDQMPERNASSANLFEETHRLRSKGAGGGDSPDRALKTGEKGRSAMVVALAHDGRHAEVARLFCRMQTEGVPVSRFVLPSVFRACARLRDSRMLRAVHSLVIKCALCQHVVVGTALVDAYVDLGLVDDARKVFDEISEPNVVSWSVIIGSYASSSRWDEVWDAFCTMQRSSVLPNVSVIVMAIQACGALGSLVRGKQMHAIASVLGFERNATVWNCLIDMYGKCGNMESSRRVFDTAICRDQVSWNTIISSYVRFGLCEVALDMIVQMQDSGFTVDRFTLASGVAACAHVGDIESGRAFHGYLIRRALDTDVIRGSALVDMYGKCGYMELARLVFENMDERNYVSWDALLSGFVENGLVEVALDIFRQMESANIKPNQHTFANLLRICGDRRYKEYGRQIHGHAIKVINQMNVVLETELIDMYAKCGCTEVSQVLFLRMNERNLVSWNTLLSGYVRDGQPLATIDIYRQMELACVGPDRYTLAGLLNLCRFHGLLNYGRQIHARLIKTGSEMNVVLQTLLVHMYSKCRRWRDAHNVCTLIRERNSHVQEAFFKVYGQDYLV
ncbi:hypothetical protein PR202_ga02658 [Eleusine coracana subsp. coracana]|uniref:Pentatricopeptide repeat-containing protein n=1 Tax=Eleusine coracana subsp. coracana TaxID=191504 RepID=A0AAV5BM96_ELECO|nr:hypothetical protein PR202_ga02658 [Eleusine coracana subsp. coracana]